MSNQKKLSPQTSESSIIRAVSRRAGNPYLLSLNCTTIFGLPPLRHAGCQAHEVARRKRNYRNYKEIIDRRPSRNGFKTKHPTRASKSSRQSKVAISPSPERPTNSPVQSADAQSSGWSRPCYDALIGPMDRHCELTSSWGIARSGHRFLRDAKGGDCRSP